MSRRSERKARVMARRVERNAWENDIARRFAQGERAATLAQEYRMSVGQIYQLPLVRDVLINRAQQRQHRDLIILQARGRGETLPTLARRFNISQSAISRIVARKLRRDS